MVEVFVDESAGPDVAQKVERRLQHFISRKVQALFEPLLNLQKDEELTGLARGFAFRLVEGLGLLPRHSVMQEVKDLDQDARGALRKHGIRFGQFTIFMPLLLKPAPTRLRLVLWSLANGLQEFPEAPPPGLVTVPALKDAPKGYDTMSGYREAGERMIRIDMLERLADMLRGEDSRGGFEAKADMLSITGMTLEQFSDLMQGLGYRAEKGEREKVKAPAEAPKPSGEATEKAEGSAEAEAASATEVDASATGEAVAEDSAAEAKAADVSEAPAEDATPAEGESAEAPAEVSAEAAAPEMEVFYTFTWGGRARQGGGQRGQRRGQDRGDSRGQEQRAGGKGKPRGAKGGQGRPGGKTGKRPPQQGSKTYSARPPRKEKQIDPDNPFAAALMGLKQGD
ncbi:helicase, putative [Roseobacter sp. SK209-2-6]|nr:helicase, putative [Roseobacter sp. SK209-2-6]